MKLRKRVAYLIVILLSLIACNSETTVVPVTLPVGTQAQVSLSTPTDTATEPPQPTPTAAPTPPISFYDLYEANVQSGAWSEGEGILKMLGYLNREIEPAEVVEGKNVMIDEATGILALAKDYLTANPNAPEKAEIERMISAILPDPEKIMPYAKEFELEAFSANPAKLAMPLELPEGQDIACDTLWRNGFNPTPSGGNPTCAAWFTFSAGGTSFRVFIPQLWQYGGNTAQRAQLLNWTRTALTDSANNFSGLATRGLLPTDVVFNELPYRENHVGTPSPTDDMAAESMYRDKCTIGIFPAAFGYSETVFEQKIAHEMFHCFQFNNLANADSTTYGQKKWWTEGTADYFSNVVYPNYNYEFGQIPSLDSQIGNMSIFRMDYENFLFFQFMGNNFNNGQIITMLSNFPRGGGESAYAQALNDFLPGNASEFFHTFGQAYLDKNIADTGLTMVPVNPEPGGITLMDMNNAIEPVTVGAYQLKWFRVGFPEKYKYTLAMGTSGDGRSSARKTNTTGGWGALPSTINTACGRRDYTVLMTNVQPGSTYGFELTITNRERKEKCVECLLGTWNLDPESLDPYVRSVIEDVMRVNSASGALTVKFDRDAMTSTWTWTNAMVDVTEPGGSGSRDTHIIEIINGEGTGDFEAEEGTTPHQGMITYGTFTGPLSIQIILDGEDMGTNSGDWSEFNFGVSAQSMYECTENSLVLTPVIPDHWIQGLTFTKVPE